MKRIYKFCKVYVYDLDSVYCYVCTFNVKLGDIVVVPVTIREIEKVGLVIEIYEELVHLSQQYKKVFRLFGGNENRVLCRQKKELDKCKEEKYKEYGLQSEYIDIANTENAKENNQYITNHIYIDKSLDFDYSRVFDLYRMRVKNKNAILDEEITEVTDIVVIDSNNKIRKKVTKAIEKYNDHITVYEKLDYYYECIGKNFKNKIFAFGNGFRTPTIVCLQRVIKKYGGIISDRVNKKTNIVIRFPIWDDIWYKTYYKNRYINLLNNSSSGQDIEILTFNEFMYLINKYEEENGFEISTINELVYINNNELWASPIGNYERELGIIQGLNFGQNLVLEETYGNNFNPRKIPNSLLELGSLEQKVLLETKKIEFGKYTQNSKYFEPISWYIIREDRDTMLLLSEYVLEFKQIDSNENNNCWEKSELYNWLNNDFYNIAFSNEEKVKFVSKKEKVTIISYDEIMKYLNQDAMISYATKYSIKDSVFQCIGEEYFNKKINCTVEWWLRDTNGKGRYRYFGSSLKFLSSCTTRWIGVRPMILIKK